MSDALNAVLDWVSNNLCPLIGINIENTASTKHIVGVMNILETVKDKVKIHLEVDIQVYEWFNTLSEFYKKDLDIIMLRYVLSYPFDLF